MLAYSYGRGAPNKVFRVKSKGMTDSTPEIKNLPIGDALETEGHGTGGAVADLNGDGVLDLLLSHGESTASQALELYQVTRGAMPALRETGKMQKHFYMQKIFKNVQFYGKTHSV